MLAWVLIAAEVSCAASAGACHDRSRFSTPCMACQVVAATTATASTMPAALVSFTTAETPPGFAPTAASEPPTAGACTTTACCMPGTRTSMPYSAAPRVLAGMSTRGTDVPMMRSALCGVSVGAAGTGSFAAATASAP